jgi:hypothetical protein
MDTRAKALAERFERANLDVRVAIAAATDDELALVCPDEQCTLVALACHIGSVHEVGIDWVQSIRDGRALPAITMDDVDRINRAYVGSKANASRSEALELLERGGAVASAGLRNLRDADLNRASPFSLFGGATISIQTLIEQVVIGDPVGHLVSIRSVLKRSATSGELSRA